jgi:hypothetical protein
MKWSSNRAPALKKIPFAQCIAYDKFLKMAYVIQWHYFYVNGAIKGLSWQ